MKKQLSAIVLAAVLALGARAWAQEVPSRETKPRAEIPDRQFDLGEVFERAEYVHVFVVRNWGTADLIIEEVKPG